MNRASITSAFLKKWHQNVEKQDLEVIDSLIADDAVFHSPVVWRPQTGKMLTKLYLAAAGQVLGGNEFEYLREIVEGNQIVLEFNQTIDGITINGIDMIVLNDQGQIVDFKVMVRPLKGMQMLHQKMGEMLEQFSKKD